MQKAMQQLNHAPAARFFRAYAPMDQVQLRGMGRTEIGSEYALE
jgi:hypothetical protein